MLRLSGAAPAALRALLPASCSASVRRLSSAALAGSGKEGGGAPASADPAAETDAATGLPLSAPPPRGLRDQVEEITIYQLEELMSATTGAGADPGVRRAVEEALEVLTVCETCNQELDAAGEWESMLSSAGLINSPKDYPAEGAAGGTPGNSGNSSGGSGGGVVLTPAHNTS